MSWPFVIMLNMQSPAWHFKFTRNLVLFSLHPESERERERILGHRTLWCITVLDFIFVLIIGCVKQGLLCRTQPTVRGIELILAAKRSQ